MKCSICGSETNMFSYKDSANGIFLCSKECKAAFRLKSYLDRLEEKRAKNEPYNQKAYNDARNMAAWLSVYLYGSGEYKKRAGKLILNFMGGN